MIRACLVLLLVTFVSIVSVSQDNKKLKLTVDEEWFGGSIMTTDQEELKGMVWYNDTDGVLSFRNGENSRVFTAKSAAGFEYYDEKIQKQRVFYSIEYDDPDQPGGKRPYFFEVLRDFKDFAVLSKTNPVVVFHGGGGVAMSPGGEAPYIKPTSTEFSQTETVYFLNSNGALAPYLTITKRSSRQIALDDKKGKNKLVDPSLFAEYITKPVYDKLVAFANDNDLKFRRREDFLTILEHYAKYYAKK